jgi:hypothetical protein
VTLVAPRKLDSWDLTRGDHFATFALGIGRAKEIERRDYDPRIELPEDQYGRYVVREDELYIGATLGVPIEEFRRNMRRYRILLKDYEPEVLYCMTPAPLEIWLVDERLLDAEMPNASRP